MSARSAFAAFAASFAVTVGVLAVSFPMPAASATLPGATVTASVPTHDLNLATDRGRAILKMRLANAAAEVCGTASSADPEGKRAVRKCRAEVQATGWKQAERALAGGDRLAAR